MKGSQLLAAQTIDGFVWPDIYILYQFESAARKVCPKMDKLLLCPHRMAKMSRNGERATVTTYHRQGMHSSEGSEHTAKALFTIKHT